MKAVKVVYFKPSGKWYCEETIEIDEGLTGYDALFKEVPKHHRLRDLYMAVFDSDDGKEPYIVPHLFVPKE